MGRLIIPRAIRRNWAINQCAVFNSQYRYDRDKRIFKFCYQPKSGELLFDLAPIFHRDMIDAYGRKKFNDYVRGICFWEKRIIYLRGHKNEAWLKATEKMLRRCGIAKNIRVIWGEKAAIELADDLQGL